MKDFLNSGCLPVDLAVGLFFGELIQMKRTGISAYKPKLFRLDEVIEITEDGGEWK